MKMRVRHLITATSVLGMACAGAVAVAGSASAAAPFTVFVAPDGQSGAADTSCSTAAFDSIQAAVEAAAIGGSVQICAGTYAESVTVDRRVNLVGRPGATVDATGDAYGIGVAASYVTVSGLTVQNASDTDDGPADGIITAGFEQGNPVVADHVTLRGNTVSGNLGSGIDLNSTSYSTAIGNSAIGNGVGINVADDLGAPATHNSVLNNITNLNFGGCGIALADHTGAGVIANTVSGNTSNDNGLATATAPDASAGSGVILASPIPGGIVKQNVISGNTFNGNGHGGVVVHAHAPGTDFSGNLVTQNHIGTNNLRTDSHDLQTTGVYIGSATPLTITVTNNFIGPDYYGVFTAGPVTTTGTNLDSGVTQASGHVATY